jgi:hypothetical protein
MLTKIEKYHQKYRQLITLRAKLLLFFGCHISTSAIIIVLTKNVNGIGDVDRHYPLNCIQRICHSGASTQEYVPMQEYD